MARAFTSLGSDLRVPEGCWTLLPEVEWEETRVKTQEWVTSLFCLCLAQEWAGRLLPCDDGEKFRNDRHAMIDIGVASHMHTGMWHTAGGYVV